MTNNFDKFKKFMVDRGLSLSLKNPSDKMFSIMLIRRGKDHKDLPAANYCLKTYYIDNMESYDRYKQDIIDICNLLNLRAYISVNTKSKEKVSKMVCHAMARNILNNEFKKPWRVFDHCFSSVQGEEKIWVVDIDYCPDDMKFVNGIIDIIHTCQRKDNDVIIDTVKTNKGIHLLTKPFNVAEFQAKFKEKHQDIFEVPVILKNHITLLYENL